MIVLALIVGAGIMIMQVSLGNFSAGPLYVLLVLSYVIGGLIYGGYRLGLKPEAAVWSLMIADITFETAIIHYSGGMASQFSLIFCLSIIASAFLLKVPGGLGIALLASISYIGYGVLQSRGLLTPPFPQMNSAEPVSSEFLQTYMHVSLFFVVGAVAGFLAERMQDKGHKLEDAQTELAQLKIDTNNILKNMSSGVLVIDSEGRIITINPAAEQILGVDKETILMKKVEPVFESTIPEFARELLRPLNSEENKRRHEIRIDRTGDDGLPIGLSTSVLRDAEGHKRGVIAVFQDLTEVRDMQERVRKADRLAAIGQLSAGIAHEIRNPLASISGSIEMLANELKLDGEHKRLMELITRESDRLDRIISDFLEFARLRPPSMDDVQLVRCIDDVILLLKNNTAIDCDIEANVDDERMMLRCDEEQMKQVFLNLAINACDVMPADGVLSIDAFAGEDGLTIAFRDQGPGIGETVRSRLFEPFFTTKEEGTGLGLAIANKIVEAHGGQIRVRNPEGGGAEFSIVLPEKTVVDDIEQRETVKSVEGS